MKLTYNEYRRRVFNAALLESLGKLQCMILNDGEECCDQDTQDMLALARKFSDSFYKEELQLEKKTVAETMARLAETSEFIRDVAEECENIADDKAEAMKDEGLEVEDDQEIELTDEDKQALEQIFDIKKPVEEIEAIRDATVKALVAEDQRSQEMKQALDIAQSQVSTGEDPKAMEETVRRLNNVGPTSLMNALLNHYSTLAVKDINEAGKFSSVSKAMADNKEIIKERACMTYQLFETANLFGIHKFTPAEIKGIAFEFYSGN